MLLDQFALINKRDQQFITQAYFTSFFKKVFHDDPSYDGLFQNPQSYIAGLSDTQIISQYKTNGYQSIKHFNKRSEEHTSELQSRGHLVCRLLLEKKKKNTN